MIKKLKLNLPHGLVVCQYYKIDKIQSPLVIITNGSNGFYNYGMFPAIQESLLDKGISSIAYNFSHGGVEEDLDYFTQLDLYEKNCMRLEVSDLVGIVEYQNKTFDSHSKLYLMAHSLGSIPTIFAAKQIAELNIKIDGVILLACVSTLNLYSKEVMENWEREKVWLMKNNRTNQMLPRGYEFLMEVKNADTIWNISNAMKGIETKYLVINGDKDESVNPNHSESLVKWAESYAKKVTHSVIKNATHTFNTKHPFEEKTDEMKEMLRVVTNWIIADS